MSPWEAEGPLTAAVRASEPLNDLSADVSVEGGCLVLRFGRFGLLPRAQRDGNGDRWGRAALVRFEPMNDGSWWVRPGWNGPRNLPQALRAVRWERPEMAIPLLVANLGTLVNAATNPF